MGAKQPHPILLQDELDHIPNILPQTGCPEKFAFRIQRGSKWAKSAIFAIFSVFRIYLPNYFFYKKFFVHLNLDLIETRIFLSSEDHCDNF